MIRLLRCCLLRCLGEWCCRLQVRATIPALHLAAAHVHSCAEVYCRAAGTMLMCPLGAALHCAGSNEALQLGINDTSLLQGTNSSATPNGFSATPVEVPLPSPDADWHMVVCGSTACCATAAAGDGPGEREGSAAVHAGPGSLVAMPVLQRGAGSLPEVC